MRGWLCVFACFLCLSLGPVLGYAKLDTPGWHSKSIYHEGALRQYRYYVPAIIGDEQALVIIFHDGGESMNSVFGKNGSGVKRWADLAESDGFVLLIPSGSDLKSGESRGNNLYWNDCRPPMKRQNRRSEADDVAFIRKVLGELNGAVEYDHARTYATGVGEGGLMALRVGFEVPELIAAVAVVNCSIPLNPDCLRSKQPVPMFLMNGTHDDVFPWIGGHIGGRHGLALSVPRMRNYLTGYNKVDREAQQFIQLADSEPSDGCVVKRQFFPGTPRGADLCFYTIEGGGHTIPSLRYEQSKKTSKKMGAQCRDIEMAVEAWHFLRSYCLGMRWRGAWI